MRKPRVLFSAALMCLLVSIAHLPLARPDDAVLPLGSTHSGWVLRFSDEFDGSELDRSKWGDGFGWGRTSGNTVGYCDAEHNRVEDGMLVQRVERRAQGGRPFSAACINSRDRFSQLYGFWEARIRAVGCRGSRAAFWAKPNDESWPPELDVVEVYGDYRNDADFTIHWREGGRHRKSKGRMTGPDFSAGFHVFGAEWTPSEVVWYVDGIERFRTARGVAFLDDAGDFYMMIGAQIVRESSTCGRWAYYSRQYVDYVRVWERSG